MPELSIIIPTRNRGMLLQQAVMSIIAQNISNYEIIIVDDSTKPAKPDFINYIEKIASIRYIVNEGEHGAARARNLGVEHALGEFIAFLDDDDIYLPGRLGNMLPYMRTGQYVFVSSGRFYQINDFSEVNKVPRQLFGEVSLKDIYRANDIDIGFMLKRDTFILLGGFDTSYHNLEDWDFVMRMAELGIGYKCRRLDYCVNVANDRDRVSKDDWVGYSQILERYNDCFDKEWAAFISATILRLRGVYNPISYLNLCVRYKNFTPGVECLKINLKRIFRFTTLRF